MRFATRIVQRNPQYEMVLSISAIEFDNVDAAAVALPDAVKGSSSSSPLPLHQGHHKSFRKPTMHQETVR